MQLLIALPMVLHLWNIRTSNKRFIIAGIFSTVVFCISLYLHNPYINAGILFVCLCFDTSKTYFSYIACILLFILTYAYTNYLIIWICIEIAFVIQGMFLNKSYEQQAQEYQNKVFDKQVQEVEHMFIIMRGWRHDYHNHLQNLKAKLNQNKILESLQYLDELEHELSDIKQLVESGNTNMDAILNAKLSLALHHKIEVQVKASLPSEVSIQDIDMSALLGNLIDNAVEACEKVDHHPYIRLYIGKYKGQLYISCTNSTNETIRKLDDEYITTKRGNHGHGLKRMNLIVDKYDGSINRKNEPGVFITEILLPLS